jgi:hypothetical protein
MNGEISGGSAAPKCIRSDLGCEEIISRLKKIRSESKSIKNFKSQLKNEDLLDGGVGLVLWFIHDKKKATRTGHLEFYLSARFVERLCPRRHGEKLVTKYLQDADIIRISRRGIKGVKPTTYELNEEWDGFISADFKINNWQKDRLKKAFQFASKEQYIRSPWLKWVDETLSLTTIPESQELQEAHKNPDKKPSTRRAVDFLRGYLEPDRRNYSKAKYCRTIYTPIASMPKELIKTLLIKNEEIAQIDITAAHPCTIPSILIEAERKFNVYGAIDEASEICNDLENGNFYKFLAENSGKSEKEAKKQFLSALNGENCHIYNDPVFKAFCKRFPVAKEVIRKIRKRGDTALNQKMATTLATAIENTIQTCCRYNIYCFPRTDEIVCRKSDANFVREVLAAYFFDETGVNALVGKQKVSFIPDEEIVWCQFCEKYKIGNDSTKLHQNIEDELPLWNIVRTNI